MQNDVFKSQQVDRRLSQSAPVLYPSLLLLSTILTHPSSSQPPDGSYLDQRGHLELTVSLEVAE